MIHRCLHTARGYGDAVQRNRLNYGVVEPEIDIQSNRCVIVNAHNLDHPTVDLAGNKVVTKSSFPVASLRIGGVGHTANIGVEHRNVVTSRHAS